MAPVKTSVTKLVNENSVNDFLKASDILVKFANNVLKNPTDQKYRKIRLGNAVVESKLLPVSGALECLFEMGFEEVILGGWYSVNIFLCSVQDTV